MCLIIRCDRVEIYCLGSLVGRTGSKGPRDLLDNLSSILPSSSAFWCIEGSNEQMTHIAKVLKFFFSLCFFLLFFAYFEFLKVFPL
jgi:hypothetical protein